MQHIIHMRIIIINNCNEAIFIWPLINILIYKYNVLYVINNYTTIRQPTK